MSNKVILELKDIHKSFDENKVHRGVEFNLYEGESLALLGGSGTGKSVLLRSIIGLEYIDRGEIVFNQVALHNLNETQISPYRLKISYAFQNGALFDSLNVFENIAYPLFEHTNSSYREVVQKVKDILKLIDLEGIERLMPSDLSGGMQKRVGLARSMIMNPKIILYDEPTAGLDPTNTRNVVEIMKKMRDRGHTSIFVTHDIPSALDLCNRVVILNEGRVSFIGTPDEFHQSDDQTVMKYKQESHYIEE